jgi:putative phage-type endonuclease
MKLHQLAQGSLEWLAYRAQHFNASDAPAMMGCSPYKSRAELLRELHTGLAADVSAGTQRVFDAGHRFEALARPLAEKIVGEDLYPVVGSSGRYSASFDGLTLGEDIVFEHKSAGAELRAAMTGEDCGPALPLHYRVQLEQQLMVSGAERALFMATLWDGDACTFSRHCWYEPDAELRAAILRGWDQFAADLAAYALPPATEPVQAEPMESLPAVSVRLDGALSVAGNLPTFAEALRAFIGRMPAKPATDNEFATVEAACKSLKKAEDALDAAEAGALASITDVEAMRRAVADCRKLARDTRLAAEKMVERRKLELKESAVMNARRALDLHIAAVNAEVAPMHILPVAADFAGAIKGKRSIDSMQDALDTTLAAAKIAADAQGRHIRANVAVFKAATGDDGALLALFADLGQLVHKPADDFALLVGSRIKAHNEAEAAKEAKRQADEAQRIAQAEQRAREQEAARIAERQRQQADAERQAAAALAAAAAPAYVESNIDRIAREQMSASAAAHAAQQAYAPQPDRAMFPVHPLPAVARASAPATAEPATLNLGAINARFKGCIKLDAAGLVLMGIEHSATDKSARLYRESDIGRICRALVALAVDVQESQAVAA